MIESIHIFVYKLSRQALVQSFVFTRLYKVFLPKP